MMHGHEKSDLVIVAMKPANKAKKAPLRRRLRGRSQRCRRSEGRGPRGIRTSKARTGLRARVACQRRWSVYGDLCRYPPEAGAVCGKAARTDLGGGRAMKRTSLPLQRREFIALLCGAAVAWPLAASAQQPAMPAVGILASVSPAPYARFIEAIKQGLREAGHVEGRNVAIEYRWADGQYDRLPQLATELVDRGVAVIILVGGGPTTAVAKAATATIPIVFDTGEDPVKTGAVVALNRPGGNATGVGLLTVAMEAKRLQLLNELVPTAAVVAIIVNPNNPQADQQLQELQAAARRTLGVQVDALKAGTPNEIDAAFANVVQRRAGALHLAG